MRAVTREQLEAVADKLMPREPPPAKPAAAPAPAGGGGGAAYRHRLKVEEWLTARGAAFRKKPKPDARGRAVWVLEACPFDAGHGRDACVMQDAAGKMSAHCFHNGCAGRTWQDFKGRLGKPDGMHYDPPYETKARARRAVPDPDAPHCTDVGNARRFVREHGADFRHCHPWKRDLVYDRRRWRVDDTGQAERWAKETVRRMYAAAAGDGDGDGRKALAEHALESEDARAIAAMVKLARSEPGVPVLPDDLDSDAFLLNVANGTLDLRDARLRPHRRDDLLTKLCPTPFDPDADCPRFLRALDAIFERDRELIRHVQCFGGYCLTGDVREHLTPIAHGAGSNGKTLLFRALLDTLGPDYSGAVPPDLLLETRGEQHPTVMADLFGKRLMVAAETGEGRRLNEGRLKALTGGDKVKARRMREDFWEFNPTHKLILFTNHKPQVRGTDHGIWRRLALWPFRVHFWDPDKGETGPPKLQADKALPDKLRDERAGILAWLVAGCLEWQRAGLRMPAKVRAATAAYRDAQDVLAAFLADCCLVGPEYNTRAMPLYRGYCEWAKSAGEREVSQRAFGESMSERGYERYRSDGMWYRGVTLRNLGSSAPG
jgi:putative DNA primase/helicase